MGRQLTASTDQAGRGETTEKHTITGTRQEDDEHEINMLHNVEKTHQLVVQPARNRQ